MQRCTLACSANRGWRLVQTSVTHYTLLIRSLRTATRGNAKRKQTQNKKTATLKQHTTGTGGIPFARLGLAGLGMFANPIT